MLGQRLGLGREGEGQGVSGQQALTSPAPQQRIPGWQRHT